jgi:hypothetical protein
MTTRATDAKPRKRRKDAGVPKELTEAHKRKMQEARERKRREREKAEKVDLKDTIKSLRERVAKAVREDDKAWKAFRRSGGDKNFNAWMRANSILMNTVAALKAHEERLASEE